jgi:hypothetical protein
MEIVANHFPLDLEIVQVLGSPFSNPAGKDPAATISLTLVTDKVNFFEFRFLIFQLDVSGKQNESNLLADLYRG